MLLHPRGYRRRSQDRVFPRISPDGEGKSHGRRGGPLSVGRNVFQHPNRVLLLKALRGIVHEDRSVDEALAVLGE